MDKRSKSRYLFGNRCFKAGWGANQNGEITVDRWSKTDSVLHVNI